MSSNGAGWGWAVAGVFGLMLLARCGDRPNDVAPQAAYAAPTDYAAATAQTDSVEYEPPPTPPLPRYEPAPREAYVSYTNCSAARTAGAAPVYADDPGYAAHLDRDGDGVGCEN